MNAVRLRKLGRVARRVQLELREAAANTRYFPWRRQLDVWRHGFVARQALLFDFDTFGFGAYLSELERRRGIRRLGRSGPLLGDKLSAFLYLREVGTPTPTVYGYADSGTYVPFGPPDERGDIVHLLAKQGKLVVKLRSGESGDGVYLFESANGRTLVNGREVRDIGPYIAGRMIVSEHVEQHVYARRIFPHSTNTLRILSCREHESGKPFVAAATHRFGTHRSQPVDNIARGGLTSRIDLETGTLWPLAAMPGAYLPLGRRIEWYDHHPDTGVRVTDTVVPRWREIVDELNRTMSLLPSFGWIGWDVAVTADRFSVIEGNVRPGLTFQAHGPLLLDQRVRTLFDAHGVLLRRPSG